jgi:hypothetical protein
MQDLLGDPIDFSRMAPQLAATLIYDLADREPPGSAERARLYALAGQHAAKARAQAARLAAAHARRAERQAETIAYIKRAAWVVPA